MWERCVKCGHGEVGEGCPGCMCEIVECRPLQSLCQVCSIKSPFLLCSNWPS